MNKLTVISFVLGSTLVMGACSDIRRERGREYMPDMAYSRAYETYSEHPELKENHINYTAMPVEGTIKRGEAFPFSIPKDKNLEDSTNYVASKAVPNPIPALDSSNLKEAERIYLINCGICHGTALDGNGPLYNSGNGPYPVAPKNLMTLTSMPDGQMFYSITYGKGQMGPYGSQLSTTQRWKIIHYIRSKQQGSSKGSGDNKESTSPSASNSTAPAGTDSASTKK